MEADPGQTLECVLVAAGGGVWLESLEGGGPAGGVTPPPSGRLGGADCAGHGCCRVCVWHTCAIVAASQVPNAVYVMCGWQRTRL